MYFAKDKSGVTTINQATIKAAIVEFFDKYPYSKFTVKQINKEVFRSVITESRLRIVLLGLCDRKPYPLKCRRTRIVAETGNKSAYLFWKNHDDIFETTT